MSVSRGSLFGSRSGGKRQNTPASFDITAVSGYIAAWDFKNRAKMWQDAARTTPASAVNDPVRVVDPVDGAANYRLTNPGGTQRPLVHANGVIWDYTLLQYLAVSPSSPVSTTDAVVFVRYAKDSNVVGQMPTIFSATGSTSQDFNEGMLFRTFYTASSGIDRLEFYTANGAAVYYEPSPILPLSTLMSLELWGTPTTRELWIDGAQKATQSTGGAYTKQFYGISIGSRIIAPAIIIGDYGNGKHSRVAIFQNATSLTAQNLTDIRAWLTA